MHGLLERYGSPLYVYDAERVRHAFTRFRNAFSYEPLELHYAIVCNKNHYLVALLHQLGCGIHANTPGDVHAALAAGVPPASIIYSGTNLDAGDLDYLARHRIRLNLDSIDQLRGAAGRGGFDDIGLRLRLDDLAHPSRIGVDAGELSEALEIAASRSIRITGLHMYAGTNTMRPDRFVEGFERLVAASAVLPDLSYLDLGGGFGVDYVEDRPPLDVAALGKSISDRMRAVSQR